MGAWAADSFANDDALDWLQDFVEQPTVEMLRDTLEHITALDADEYLEAPDCCEAIAAAEIVAALAGKPAANLPHDLQTWLCSDHGLKIETLNIVASATIDRIAQASELKDLWAGSEFYPQWLAAMTDLQCRLA